MRIFGVLRYCSINWKSFFKDETQLCNALGKDGWKNYAKKYYCSRHSTKHYWNGHTTIDSDSNLFVENKDALDNLKKSTILIKIINSIILKIVIFYSKSINILYNYFCKLNY